MFRIAAGCIVLAGALAGAVTLLYTPAVFSALGIDTIALEVVNGKLDASSLAALDISGRRFSAAEIAHLLDVKAVVAPVRLSLPISLLALAAIAWRRPDHLRSGALLALLVQASVVAALVASYGLYGYARTSDLLHALFFAPGSYVFAKGTAMAQIYAPSDMVAGALFVIAATAAVTLLLWTLARLLASRI